MVVPFLDLKAQYQSIKSEIDSALDSVLNQGCFIQGQYVQDFEKNFAKDYGMNHCISVANGTDAIYISLKVLGIGIGDEVITSAFSWVSVSQAIRQTGARPVFIDIESDYYHLDPEKIISKISPQTKAILVIHLYGQSCDILSIQAIAKDYGLFLIEDCAQAHFCKYGEDLVGTFGIVSTFSFYPSKNLGAYGDAGAILTNDEDLGRKMRLFANHGSLKEYEYETEGVNSRMDALQAAILGVKLNHIHEWNEKRYVLALLYHEGLGSVEWIKIPKIREGGTHIFHIYAVRCRNRDELLVYLREHGITAKIHYPTALPLMRINGDLSWDLRDFSVVFEVQKEVLSLPIYPEMTDEMIFFVTETIKKARV